MSEYHYNPTEAIDSNALLKELLAHAASGTPMEVTCSLVADDELTARRGDTEKRTFALAPDSVHFGDETYVVAQDLTTNQWVLVTITADSVTITVVI